MRDRFHVIMNFLFFQAGYFACVFGGATGWPWLGPAVVLGAVAWHLWRVGDRIAEATLLALVLLVGAVFESAIAGTGWIEYPSGAVVPWLAPPWILALWLLFATTLNLCLGWLRRRPWLAIALGGIGGPLSFFGGSKLQAVTLLDPVAVLATLSVSWAVLMPLVMWLASQFDGWHAPPSSDTSRTSSPDRGRTLLGSG